MAGRYDRARSAVVVSAIAIMCAACDEGRRGMIVVEGFASPSAVGNALVVPSTLPFEILPTLGCPVLSPFASTLSLVIDQRGASDVVLHEAGFQFVDAGGFVSPLFFAQSELGLLFGSTFIAAGTSRTFAFDARFGCEFRSSPKSMTARLVLLDRQGRRHERTLRNRM